MVYFDNFGTSCYYPNPMDLFFSSNNSGDVGIKNAANWINIDIRQN